MNIISKSSERLAVPKLTSILLIIAVLLPTSSCRESQQQQQQQQQQLAVSRKSTVLDPENFDQLMPLLVHKRSDTSLANARPRGGELEWFNMEATGLGDLEEADAVRKMLRRSIELEGRLIKRQMAANNSPRQRDEPDRLAGHLRGAPSAPLTSRPAKRTNQILEAPTQAELRLLAAAMALRENDEQIAQARLDSMSRLERMLRDRDFLGAMEEGEKRIARLGKRADNDEDNSQAAALFGFERRPSGAEDRPSSGAEGDDEEGELPLNDSLNSRISLLTTRKIQPDTDSLVSRSAAAIDDIMSGVQAEYPGDTNGGSQAFGTVYEGPQSTDRYSREGATGGRANRTTSGHFLPRFARASPL